MAFTPDMTGKASEIDDPQHLFARIGYRAYLAWRDKDEAKAELYARYNEAEMRRLLELQGARS